MNSQSKEILKYLQEGNEITPIEALERFNCFRLGARVYDLKKLGYEIETRMVGDKKRWAQYKLRTKPKQLELVENGLE